MHVYSMSPARSYQNVSLESLLADADPHRLIALLYAGALESISRARHCLTIGDVGSRGKAINRAIRIIDEGLRNALNLDSGALAQDLDRLYDYMIRRLTSAHSRANDAMLGEVQGLLTGLSEAWLAIAPSRR